MHNLEAGLRVVSVVGLQNSGKTTFVREMVRIWAAQGLKVGVIKHDGHADAHRTDDWEKENGDTRLAAAAGARYTMVSGGGQTLMRSASDPIYSNPFALIRRMASQAAADGQSLDLVVVEGFKRAALSKIVLIASDHQAAWLNSESLADVFCVVRRNQVNLRLDRSIPVYDVTQVEDVCTAVLHDPRFRFQWQP